ncbi:MAG TPA: DnaJ domain-containing protein, partial [Sphingomicrobium sp.]
MNSSVKSRRNHYQILGLEVGATDADIAAAFATESRKIIQNPRVNEPDVREKARQVRTAHQTLRDPAKRSAYDASLGLGAKESATAPEAAVESSVRPFVAATREETKADEHVAAAPNAGPKAGAAARVRARRAEPNARTGLPEGIVVASAAAAAAAAGTA